MKSRDVAKGNSTIVRCACSLCVGIYVTPPRVVVTPFPFSGLRLSDAYLISKARKKGGGDDRSCLGAESDIEQNQKTPEIQIIYK